LQGLKTNAGQPNPEKNIDEFASVLISKLSAVRKSREDETLLKQKLQQVGDCDSSIASFDQQQQQRKRYQNQVGGFCRPELSLI
jgi:hypothetical protein